MLSNLPWRVADCNAAWSLLLFSVFLGKGLNNECESKQTWRSEVGHLQMFYLSFTESHRYRPKSLFRLGFRVSCRTKYLKRVGIYFRTQQTDGDSAWSSCRHLSLTSPIIANQNIYFFSDPFLRSSNEKQSTVSAFASVSTVINFWAGSFPKTLSVIIHYWFADRDRLASQVSYSKGEFLEVLWAAVQMNLNFV